MATRVGLGGSQWFEWEYVVADNTIVITRNSDANGSIVIRNQDLTVEGTLNATTAAISTIGADTVNCAGIIKGTSFTVGATAGYSGTCDAARTATFVGGLATTC